MAQDRFIKLTNMITEETDLPRPICQWSVGSAEFDEYIKSTWSRWDESTSSLQTLWSELMTLLPHHHTRHFPHVSSSNSPVHECLKHRKGRIHGWSDHPGIVVTGQGCSQEWSGNAGHLSFPQGMESTVTSVISTSGNKQHFCSRWHPDQGGTRSENLLKEVTLLFISKDLISCSLEVCNIPGKLNILAGYLSSRNRFFTEWFHHPEVFRWITSFGTTHTVIFLWLVQTTRSQFMSAQYRIQFLYS